MLIPAFGATWLRFGARFCVAAVAVLHPLAQTPGRTSEAAEISVLSFQGAVQTRRAGSPQWTPVATNQVLQPGDFLRVPELGQLALRWSDQSILRFDEFAEFQIAQDLGRGKVRGWSLLRGLVHFFHRDAPAEVEFKTRTASAAVRGTEFTVAVDDAGLTTVNVLDGWVDLRNDQGRVEVRTGQQGLAEPGRMPTIRPLLEAVNVIQWMLYYPGVLDPDELGLSPAESAWLERSLTAYRAGDLLQALALFPTDRAPASPSERLYRSALLLAVGRVDRTEAALASLAAEPGAGERSIRLAAALRQLIAAVKFQPWERARPAELASEWLAESYYRQSRAELPAALAAARAAVGRSPTFGFAWERVAELEFGFGRIAAAQAGLKLSLELAPRNAQAVALDGFLLAAQNRIGPALGAFDRAVALDAGLANAWLGRGLCQIRLGRTEAGRRDLLAAAAMEPQRALLRSYLGKAYAEARDWNRATRELGLAQGLDPRDPTAWLYSALLAQQNNRINEAVSQMEKARDLAGNRQLYRSRLLLDQDRAVASANLAGIYRDAGMFDVSVREAVRAVNDDYANFSAHLFLANSYNEIRDPKSGNLRFDTPASSEYLLANLLAPVGAGTLSATVSQQEYSRLFERDRFGLSSITEYSSAGDWLQAAAQYGTVGNAEYALEAFYRSETGRRPNNDLQSRLLRLEVKQQLTPQDTVQIQAGQAEVSGGDLVQRYNPTDPTGFDLTFRTKEVQEPLLALGYHRQWSPGSHTLFLANYVHDSYHLRDDERPALAVDRSSGAIDDVAPFTVTERLQGRQNLYSAEVQQLWTRPSGHTIVGGRAQWGRLGGDMTLPEVGDFQPYFPSPPEIKFAQDIAGDFHRWALYAYHQQELFEVLKLTAGLAYDDLRFPENVLNAPFSDGKRSLRRLSPKAGLIWTPARTTTIRAAFTQSLTGANLDQAFPLEPTQVAGFTQTYRSLVPESVAGGIPGSRLETVGLSLEQKLDRVTYLGIAAELLKSNSRRTRGAFELPPYGGLGLAGPFPLEDEFGYRERSVAVTLNRLVGDLWAVGARYRLSQARLAQDLVDVPATIFSMVPSLRQTGVLHQVQLLAACNHPSGLFGRFEAFWNAQSNTGYLPDQPGDAFWQFNFLAGYRLRGRRAELVLGCLNLADRDYRLNPLNLHAELPRERTLVARLTLNL